MINTANNNYFTWVCVCVHNMFPITQDFLFKNLTQNEFQLKLFLITDMRARYAKRSFTRQTDRQRGLWMSHGADRVADRRTFS